MKLQEAEEYAKNANINAVAAFIQESADEYDRISIQILKETLLQAYIDQNRDI